MCGRYTISKTTEEILERFNVLKEIFELTPNYNVAPSHMVPAVFSQTNDEKETVRVMQVIKWGLVPFWVRDTRSHKPFINTRVETVLEKPSFKSSLAKKRCIIPADGFYEWKTVEGKKQPIRIRLPGEELMGFAGLYDDAFGRWLSQHSHLRHYYGALQRGHGAHPQPHARYPDARRRSCLVRSGYERP